MPKFLVKKRQSGVDAWGDDFEHEYDDWIIEASSREVLEEQIKRLHNLEVYSNEFLMLELVGEYLGYKQGVTMESLFHHYREELRVQHK